MDHKVRILKMKGEDKAQTRNIYRNLTKKVYSYQVKQRAEKAGERGKRSEKK